MNDVFGTIVFLTTGISFGVLILFSTFIKRRAISATKGIVWYYETLEDILEMEGKVKLTYKASCQELNQLQKAFNKFAKTINITNKTIREGEEY